MSDAYIGCCSSYRECSNKGTCLKRDLMSSCYYWLLNLSKGRNFYSVKKPEVKADGYLYLIFNGQAFRISGRSDKGYSYPIGPNNIKEIAAVFKSFGLEIAENCEDYSCIIEGTPQDPAAYRVNFSIGEKLYNIKNYNGFEIQEAYARKILKGFPKEFKPELARWCSNGYFSMRNETDPAEAQIKPAEINVSRQSYSDIPGYQVKQIITDKVNSILSSKHLKTGQISIFDLIS